MYDFILPRDLRVSEVWSDVEFQCLAAIWLQAAAYRGYETDDQKDTRYN